MTGDKTDVLFRLMMTGISDWGQNAVCSHGYGCWQINNTKGYVDVMIGSLNLGVSMISFLAPTGYRFTGRRKLVVVVVV